MGNSCIIPNSCTRKKICMKINFLFFIVLLISYVFLCFKAFCFLCLFFFQRNLSITCFLQHNYDKIYQFQPLKLKISIFIQINGKDPICIDIVHKIIESRIPTTVSPPPPPSYQSHSNVYIFLLKQDICVVLTVLKTREKILKVHIMMLKIYLIEECIIIKTK